MLVTRSEMVTDDKLSQLENAKSPMLVTLFGMVIEVKLQQQEKAPSPMLTTLFGMVTYYTRRNSKTHFPQCLSHDSKW